MPSEEDNTRLMWAILSQRIENGKLTNVDWVKVAADLGINKPHTASCRWYALFKTLKAQNLPGTGSPDGTPTKAATLAKTTPKKVKTANPKARSAVTKARGSAKKRSVTEIYEDEDADDDEEGTPSKRDFVMAEQSEASFDEFQQENENENRQNDEFYDALQILEEDYEG